MSLPFFSPGPTQIFFNNGPTSVLINPLVSAPTGWSPGPPSGDYALELTTTVYQNFILWTNIIAEAKDGSDTTYGSFASTPAEQGFWTELTLLGANPPDRTKGKLVFRAKHTSGGGTIYFDIFLQNLANFYHFVTAVPFTITTDWAWYSYDLDGTGGALGDPDYTDADLGVVMRNAAGYANQPVQISEVWVDAYVP